MLRFALPRALTGFRRLEPLVGHSGISGAFWFHDPARDLAVAGTVNQLADRRLPYRFMLKALGAGP